MTFFERLNNNEKEDSVSDIEPIEESVGFVVKNESDIEKIVEMPLVEACKELYRKNIETVSSSANKKDIENSTVYIEIDKETLSSRNKEILKEIKKDKKFDYLKISDDKSEKTIKVEILLKKTGFSIKEVEEKVKDFTKRLERQEPRWIREKHVYKIEDLEGIYSLESGSTGKEEWEKEGYYYDPESNLFFESEDHYKKWKEYL
jgi:hypothetical protein